MPDSLHQLLPFCLARCLKTGLLRNIPPSRSHRFREIRDCGLPKFHYISVMKRAMPLKVEFDGEPYSNPQFDFDFESPMATGFYTGGVGYKVGIDDTVSYSGRQSHKMQFVGDGVTQK